MSARKLTATRQVAFLRAVNVGGRILKMERLRAVLASLGFGAVETFIASGNAIFDAPAGDAVALERRIAEALGAELGWEVPTFVRTVAEVAAAATRAPFGEEEPREGHTLHVVFLERTADAEVARRLHALRSSYDDFAVDGREAYWLCRGRSSDSKITPAVLERALGMRMTARNVSTVRKLAAKYAP